MPGSVIPCPVQINAHWIVGEVGQNPSVLWTISFFLDHLHSDYECRGIERSEPDPSFGVPQHQSSCDFHI